VALGFARLAIIDLSSAGHQPMESPDGRHTIVFNGEIYNFPDLRRELEQAGETFAGHSDTEVLLRLFVREGLERCLAKLRGMFAFAVWDRSERRLFLARDRLGVKPLVYAQTPKGFAFASEIAALFDLDPALSREADPEAIDHYLTLNYIPAPLSGFRAIRKLPPAHAMVVREGKVERLFRYWDIDPEPSSRLSFAEACEALREQVLEATRIRLVSDVPLGAFLSGGIDSSITVAAMARLGSQPPETFAIGFEDEKFNELPYAREVASHLGTRHHEMLVREDAYAVVPEMIERLGEPMADNSVMPTFFVSRFARERVTVALTGDGGDESFAGYRRFYQMRRLDWLAGRGLIPAWSGLRRGAIAVENRLRSNRRHRRFPATRADEALSLQGIERYKHLIALFTDAEKRSLLTPAFAAQVTPGGPGRYLDERLGTRGSDELNRYLRMEATSYLAEDILFKVDAASMAVSLECRSPFLDHRLVEFAASLPGRYKLSATGRHKHILKEAFAPWLPKGFMDRPKKGFSVPLTRWLREGLSEVMRETLLGRRTLEPWIDQASVKRMVDEHLDGRASHPMKLWSLLVLGLWAERFGVSA
jgi:asparagine synthase (glutamine-hydrolysing)